MKHTEIITCPICKGDGPAVYETVKGVTRMQSMECPGDCWNTEAGQYMLRILNAKPVV